MMLERQQLVEMLRARGDHELADRVLRELPTRVDPAEHGELFEGLELDLDAGDAARHADAAPREGSDGLPTSGPAEQAREGAERPNSSH